MKSIKLNAEFYMLLREGLYWIAKDPARYGEFMQYADLSDEALLESIRALKDKELLTQIQEAKGN